MAKKKTLPQPNKLGYYTTADIAEFFEVTPATVRGWIKQGYLAASRPLPEGKRAKTANGHWQIEPEHIEAIRQYRPRMTNSLKKQWIPLYGKSIKEQYNG